MLGSSITNRTHRVGPDGIVIRSVLRLRNRIQQRWRSRWAESKVNEKHNEDAPDPQNPDAFEEAIRIAAQSLGFDPAPYIAAVRADNASQPSIADLFQIEEALWKQFSAAEPECSGDRPQVQLVAWGWVAQSFRQAHSAFILHRLGFPDSAVANARSAVEHGVLLSLLAGVELAEDVLEALEFQYLRRAKASIPLVPDEAVAEMDLVDTLLGNLTGQRATGVTAFEQVCGHLESGERVYLHYRGLSNAVHPGFASAGPIMLSAFKSIEDELPTLSNEPVYIGTEMALTLAIGGCLWAGWSADLLLDNEYFGPSLSQIASELGLKPLKMKEGDPLGRAPQ